MMPKKLLEFGGIAVAVMAVFVADAAVVAKKQSVIQTGTTVRSRVPANGVYDQDCYEKYYGCMDQFCITDNTNGGSCGCSDVNADLEKQFTSIQDTLIEAERVRTIEVERVQAGAQADIIFNGSRRYDKNGNVVYDAPEATKEERRASLLALWDNTLVGDEEDVFEDIEETIADKTGASLFDAAEKLCRVQMPSSCDKDLEFLHQLYARQIVADCKAFENSIAQNKAKADAELADANASVRAALKESFAEANKYDLGQCMLEFRKCMQSDDACGKGWINCVSTIASENMQNNTTKSTARTKVPTVDVYDITASTMEMLDAKRNICETVLNKCVAVRDMVWPAFLREAAPTIRVAESNAESMFRQSCLTNISNCIQNACRDDIAGKGVETMDACLSRPDMARSFCKVEIDPCERMEPLIWGYVVDKLAAMRVDACTKEVKDCFTDEDRCGADFSNCIGMDYDYIHNICPLDKLVVCKANRPNFSMDDVDSMLMGLYLNIDNAALRNCQNLVDTKMAEICGSTTDCNKFAADDTLGTGSLHSQKDGTTYRVTGMISFGSIKMGDASGKVKDTGSDSSKRLAPGEIGVQEYLAQIRARNEDVPNADVIISSIEEELNNIAGTINRTISMIEQDPEIQYCVSGRSLEHITGQAGVKTVARFPNLLNQVKMQIAVAALRKAQDNYNAKFNAAVADATKNASADLAQYMCQKIAEKIADNGAQGASLSRAPDDLLTPYAISYDVGSGLSTQDLIRGGAGVLQVNGATFNNAGYLGGQTVDGRAMTKNVSALFSRETRTCHICTQTVTESCETKGSMSWFHNNRNMSCETIASEEKCEDVKM